MERLQKIIAESGYCSRRKAEELIIAGRVSVNGFQVKELGSKADFSDEIRIDGELLNKEEKVVFLLNKPKNVISSASDDKGRVCVTDLIDCKYRLYPMGRLDYDSTGLILLSNDGALMQRLIHPKYEIDKLYEVTIDGLIHDDEVKKLENGVMVDGYLTKPCRIEIIKKNENKYTTFLSITIHEGRNRQIRKMFGSLGYRVIKLNRIKEANIELGNLKSGEYRRLKPYELKKLNDYLNNIR